MPTWIPFQSAATWIILFVLIFIFIKTGHRIGTFHIARSKGDVKGTPAIETALFGLLGLLVAFSFSGASSRFDVRRNLIVEEANRIATGYARIEMLPEASRPAIREKFRQYLDSRLEAYSLLPDIEAAEAEMKRTKVIEDELWTTSVAAARESQWAPAATLYLPALNAMFDIATSRAMAARMHPPMVIFIMLGIVIMAVALLAGFTMALSNARSWLHIVVFCLIFALTMYVIIDMEFPRFGLIRVDSFDKVLIDLRQSMDN